MKKTTCGKKREMKKQIRVQVVKISSRVDTMGVETRKDTGER